MPMDLRARASQLPFVAAADGDKSRKPDLRVTGRQLGLPSRCSFLGLTLTRGLRLPKASSQFAVGTIAGDRSLDLTGRPFRRDRLESYRYGPHRA